MSGPTVPGQGGGGQSSLLLLAPANTDQEVVACLELLSVGDPPNERVLFVSFGRSPDELLDHWVSHIEGWPAEFAVIAVNDVTRSPSSQAATSQPSTPMTVETVSPTNLTRLGVRITEFLERWEPAGEEIVVCFDSVTLLNQYAETDILTRFLHVLSGHIKAADARAHFHLDPLTVEDPTIAKLKTVVDEVADVGMNGSSGESHG